MNLCFFAVFFFASFLNASPVKRVVNGELFASQKIQSSEFIRVWRYLIPRTDLKDFAKASKFGFHSEDDLIAFLQFILFQLKYQNLHEKYIDSINIALLLSFEKSLSQFDSLTDLSPVSDSDVVMAYEYVIKKDEKNALQRVNSLKLVASSDFNFVQSFFRDIGELSVLVFNRKFLKEGDVVIVEDKNSYRVYYIASSSYKQKPILSVKATIKDLFLNIIENSLDFDCLDIEN